MSIRNWTNTGYKILFMLKMHQEPDIDSLIMFAQDD